MILVLQNLPGKIFILQGIRVKNKSSNFTQEKSDNT
ncbi:hypothetical protein B6N60_00655 [Richelia sinica FACHB-800]|uniref:Uncharacterized protein n=1 Tax=Richelia sinica FACHB-800 TaxID=1357546 RepID=A0A975T5R7_9NOST|nr:hypothetical protein B6N60_00655 [Richelia sinica FACHB-800]